MPIHAKNARGGSPPPQTPLNGSISSQLAILIKSHQNLPMFQTFSTSRPTPNQRKTRLQKLRDSLKKQKLHAFLIPRANAFQGEYVPPSDERLAWLTGFTGSAGTAAILANHAALFTDGRYTLQAQTQLQNTEIKTYPPNLLAPWLAQQLPQKARIGYDPWLHTTASLNALRQALTKKTIALIPQTPNPIDEIWKDQPNPPNTPVEIHPLAFAGKSSSAKRAAIAKELRRQKHDAFILTDPASLCWLLNIRGRDVPHTPFLLCFGILEKTGRAALFLDSSRLSNETRAHLGADVAICPPETFADRLRALKGQTARLAETQAPDRIRMILEEAGASVVLASDPCLLPKARKNRAERQGAREAHRMDGIALAKFLCWLDREGASGEIDEIRAVRKLEEFRREEPALQEISFDTISGAGANGAIVHYKVDEESNRRLRAGDLYLVDSGGQYRHGTTDVTRTVAIGARAARPSDEMRDRFTRVLRGHIALARARFPEGTAGSQLDVLARAPLWEAGLDFDHGTGHGVGSYLSVHEGPQGISSRAGASLYEGMVLSNEPGYYKAGFYGIRIENLMLVRAAARVGGGGERVMLSFETLTLAPIDRFLIMAEMLSVEERFWLDSYHGEVYRRLSSFLDEDIRVWLEEATAPLQ